MVWIILFVLIIAVSFLLAYRSVRHYPDQFDQIPNNLIFLIRNQQIVDDKLLNSLHKNLSSRGGVLSFERLFKGQRQALVCYGPIDVLEPFSTRLNLLELEDYSLNTFPYQLAWEIRVSNPQQVGQLFDKFSNIGADEQLWRQVVLKPASEGLYEITTRIVFNTQNNNRVAVMKEELLNLGQVYSTSEVVEFYQKRRHSITPDKGIMVSVEDVRKLLGS